MSRPQRIKVEVAANVRGYIAAGLAVLFFLSYRYLGAADPT